MKHCNLCNINIDSDRKYCPLCFNDVEDLGGDKSVPILLSRTKNDNFEKHSYFLTRLFLFLSLAIVGISVFINILTKGVFWSLLVALCIVYIWILIEHTILSKRGAFEKVLFQVAGIVSILVVCNIISGGGEWLVNVVIPSVALATTTILLLISLIGKNRRSQFLLSFLFIYIMFLIMSLVFVLAHFDTFKILNLINIMYTSLAILGTILFGFRIIKNEGGRRLHI